MPDKMMPAMRRVDQNDPTLTYLLMCEPPTTVEKDDPHFGMTYITDDGPALKRICDSIGENAYLQDVCFDAPLGLSNMVARSTYFAGLKRNTSIHSLGLSRCELSEGVGHEVLKAFKENNKHLTKFALWRCMIRDGGTRALSSTLTRCTYLKEISLSSCRIDDVIVENLVQSVRGNRHLKRLDLQDNIIKRAGCESLVTLLQDPNCNLVTLDLNNNMIDNDGATIMADGLSNNHKLEGVCLDGNDDISASGWNAFFRVLSNPSSINATYFSNHTLCRIASFGSVKVAGSRLYDEDGLIPSRLLSLIELNGIGDDNNLVARQKILDCHFSGDFNMEPFVESNMEMKVFSHVLGWVGRSSDSLSHSAMFNLLQKMPTLCAVAPPIRGFVKTHQSDDNIVLGHQYEHRSAGVKSRLGAIFGPFWRLKKMKPFGKKCPVYIVDQRTRLGNMIQSSESIS